MKLNIYWEQLPYSKKDNASIEEKLADVLCGWDRTPYKNGACAKGAGVSCYQFICAILDEMQGRTANRQMRLPATLGRAKRGSTPAIAHAMMQRFFPASKVPSRKVQPGDILLVGHPEIGPAHVMLVGPEPRTLWHATSGPGVHKTGFSGMGDDQVVKIYRLDGRRDRWLS